MTHNRIKTGNKSTFLASLEGGTARIKSHTTTERTHKVTHESELETSPRGCRPPFIDCTQYLPRLLVAVPISLVYAAQSQDGPLSSAMVHTTQHNS